MSVRPRSVPRGIYRLLLLLYPRSFRREYGGLMTQAFSDQLKEKGDARTWMFVLADLSFSVPQQILEVSLMSQKWMAALAATGSCLVLAAFVIGTGPPLLLMVGLGLVLGLSGFLSLWAAKRNGTSTEFSYGLSDPKAWTWWTVLAALLAVTYVVAAAGQLISDPKGTNVGALAIMTGFAGLIAGGLRLRSQSRIAGNWMIVVATIPALAFFWIVVPAVVGIAIIIGAATEISRATPQAPLTA